MKTETLRDKTIKDNFVFGAVMRNPKQCKALLECVLGIKIRRIEYPELEKTIDKALRAKGVRLDVYVEDEANTIYNIEMQATDKQNLPRRMRYYQGMIDLNIIDKGQKYNSLKKSYVIFICDYDEFGQGRHIYTFENVCLEDPTLKFGDDTVKIVLNTKGTMDDVSKELKELLHYIGGAKPTTDLTRGLDDEVEKVKSSKEWRREYMTQLMRDNENKMIGRIWTIVEQIRRKMDVLSVDDMVDLYGVSTEVVTTILSLIEENPDWDDEDVAIKVDCLCIYKGN